MKILVDSEEIPNARTGIPRLTLLDTFAFTEVFDSVELLISAEKQKSLVNSQEYLLLSEECAMTGKDAPRINGRRPINSKVWFWQLTGGLGKKSVGESNFRYTSLFPGVYRKQTGSVDIVRLCDPFRSQNQVALNEVPWKKKKLVIARDLRDFHFRKKLVDGSLLVAISQHTREKFSLEYGVPQEKFHVIWPSVGFRRNNSFVREMPSHQNPYLICVMSQRQRKDPVFVINAWARIASKLEIDLFVVGMVPTSQLIKEAIKFLDKKRLKIFEFLPASKLVELQRGAIASIFASRGEGFGLPVAESLFQGVPVIHNDLAVLKEVSGGVGSIFSLEDEGLLQEVLLKLSWSNPDYFHLRQKSWERGGLFSHEYSSHAWAKLVSL